MARVWARPANLAGSTWSPSEFVNLVYLCYVTNNLILGYFLGLSDNNCNYKINHVVTHHSPTYFKDFSHDDDSDSDAPLPLPDLLSSAVEEPALFNLEITQWGIWTGSAERIWKDLDLFYNLESGVLERTDQGPGSVADEAKALMHDGASEHDHGPYAGLPWIPMPAKSTKKSF